MYTLRIYLSNSIIDIDYCLNKHFHNDNRDERSNAAELQSQKSSSPSLSHLGVRILQSPSRHATVLLSGSGISVFTEFGRGKKLH